MTATIVFTQGRPIDRNAILTRDAISGTVTASDVQAKLPGVSGGNSHSFGATLDGRRLHVGPGLVVTIPAGTCGLSGWAAESR